MLLLLQFLSDVCSKPNEKLRDVVEAITGTLEKERKELEEFINTINSKIKSLRNSDPNSNDSSSINRNDRDDQKSSSNSNSSSNSSSNSKPNRQLSKVWNQHLKKAKKQLAERPMIIASEYVCCTSADRIRELNDKILAAFQEKKYFDHIVRRFPNGYWNVEQVVHTLKMQMKSDQHRQPFMKWKEFEAAINVAIGDTLSEKELQEIIEWMHRCGVLLHFNEGSEQKNTHNSNALQNGIPMQEEQPKPLQQLQSEQQQTTTNNNKQQASLNYSANQCCAICTGRCHGALSNGRLLLMLHPCFSNLLKDIVLLNALQKCGEKPIFLCLK